MNITSRILGEAMRKVAMRKVRSPTEGEVAIAKDPYWAFNYARYNIKGRFPEGEPAIATEPRLAKLYLKQFPEAKLEWAMNGWIDWLDL